MTCGDLDIYVSYTETNPSPVVYEEYYSATHGTPAVITIRDSSNAGSPIYITVVGARLSSSVAQRYGCSRYHWTISVRRYHCGLLSIVCLSVCCGLSVCCVCWFVMSVGLLCLLVGLLCLSVCCVCWFVVTVGLLCLFVCCVCWFVVSVPVDHQCA